MTSASRPNPATDAVVRPTGLQVFIAGRVQAMLDGIVIECRGLALNTGPDLQPQRREEAAAAVVVHAGCLSPDTGT